MAQTAEQTKTTTLAAIRKESAETAISNLPEVSVGFTTSQGFELVQRVSKMFSTSSLVPKEYQGNMPNCAIALNMAHRIGADPIQVMQNLYIVHGRPSWSSQFLIATFNKSGRFSALRYEFFGTEGTDEWGCRAYAVEKETGETLYGSRVTIAIAKKEGWYAKSNSKWQSIPQQMLMYRAASWFVRAYAPELAMGLHTIEETRDMGPNAPEFTTTIEDLRESQLPIDPEASVLEAEAKPVEEPPKETKQIPFPEA